MNKRTKKLIDGYTSNMAALELQIKSLNDAIITLYNCIHGVEVRLESLTKIAEAQLSVQKNIFETKGQKGVIFSQQEFYKNTQLNFEVVKNLLVKLKNKK